MRKLSGEGGRVEEQEASRLTCREKRQRIARWPSERKGEKSRTRGQKNSEEEEE